MAWDVHFTVLGLLVVGYLIRLLVFLRWRAGCIRDGDSPDNLYIRWKFKQFTQIWAILFVVYLGPGMMVDLIWQEDRANRVKRAVAAQERREAEEARAQYEQEVLTSLREIRRALGIEDPPEIGDDE